MTKRADQALLDEMFNGLAALNPGDKVPSNLYIADYENGEVPAWYVLKTDRSPLTGQVFLLLEDRSNLNLPDLFHPDGWKPRKMVIAGPNKILGSPIFMPEEGQEYGPGMMHDLVQNARLNRNNKPEEQ